MCINTKRHSCGICVKLKSLLKQHYRKVKAEDQFHDHPHYTSIKPVRSSFRCLICDKAFGFRQLLKAHLRNHHFANIKNEVKEEQCENELIEEQSEAKIGQHEVNKEEWEVNKDQFEVNKEQYEVNKEQGEVKNEQLKIKQEQFDEDTDVDDNPLTNEVIDEPFAAEENEDTDTGPALNQITELPTPQEEDTPKLVEAVQEERPTKRKRGPYKKRKPFKCDRCRESFDTDDKLAEHRKRAHFVPTKHKCEHCNFETFYNQALVLHRRKKHQIETPSDEEGATGAEEKLEPKSGIYKTTQPNKDEPTVYFGCMLCTKTFMCKNYLQNHMKRFHKKKWSDEYMRIIPKETIAAGGTELLMCPECEKPCRNKKALRDHLRSVHNILWSSVFKELAIEAVKGNLSCQICDVTFNKMKDLSNHLQDVHQISEPFAQDLTREGDLFPCSECDKAFSNQQDLGNHQKQVHQQSKRYVANGFICPLCPGRFRTIKAVREHLRVQHRRLWKTFDTATKDKIRFSSDLPTGEPAPKISRRSTNDIPNEKSDNATDERPFACEFCGACFKHKAYLETHRRSHTGEKPYKCPHCDKCFNAYSSRTKHIMTHTRVYNYICQICGRKFLLQSGLNQHMKWHSEERPYKCDQCTKAFKTGQMLKEHKRVHTGERPYPCLACDKKFRWRYNYMTHMKSHHPEILPELLKKDKELLAQKEKDREFTPRGPRKRPGKTTPVDNEAGNLETASTSKSDDVVQLDTSESASTSKIGDVFNVDTTELATASNPEEVLNLATAEAAPNTHNKPESSGSDWPPTEPLPSHSGNSDLLTTAMGYVNPYGIMPHTPAMYDYLNQMRGGGDQVPGTGHYMGFNPQQAQYPPRY